MQQAHETTGSGAQAAPDTQQARPPATADMPTWWDHIPREIASMLMTVRPPMPAADEIEASRKLTAALVAARKAIPPIPKDQTVKYKSQRTNELIEYDFASLDSIHQAITGPLSDNGLMLTTLTSPYAIVAVLLHEGNGMLVSWLDLAPSSDIQGLAKQITMLRRYLTVQLLGLAAEEESGERDISDTARAGTGGRRAEARPQPAAGEPEAAPRPEQAAARPQPAAESPQQRPRPAGDQDAQARQQVLSRADAALAKLPPGQAGELREKFGEQPAKLLAAAIEALGLAAEGGEAETEEAIAAGFRVLGRPKAEEMALRSEYIGRPADLLVEVRIRADAAAARGISALRLEPAAEAALRKEYRDKPYELLARVRELYASRGQQAGA